MADINGLTGSITFGSGYTVLADAWRMRILAAPQDLTPLSPASNHQQLMGAGLLKGAAGSYHCKLSVPPTALVTSGSTYGADHEAWVFNSNCEARETTPLGALWRTFVAGLLTSGAQVVTFLDDSNALPAGGDVATLVLNADGARAYSVPAVALDTQLGVDTQDRDRRAITSYAATGLPSASGGLPLAGVTGAATLTSITGRYYSCAILVTSVTVSVNRRTGLGSIDVEFVVNGAVTPH